MLLHLSPAAPEDPVLFSGTLRHNLDPFEQFTEGRILEVEIGGFTIPMIGGMSCGIVMNKWHDDISFVFFQEYDYVSLKIIGVPADMTILTRKLRLKQVDLNTVAFPGLVFCLWMAYIITVNSLCLSINFCGGMDIHFTIHFT